jgi:hypothetical protein
MRQRRHKEHPWGRLNLHLPMVDVEDVEEVKEHPRTSHSPRSAEEVT